MRRHTCVLVAAVVAGCGGPSFDGHWRGTLTQAAQCSNGASATRELVMDLTATQDGDSVLFAGNTSCGIITTTVDGDTATLQSIICAPLVSDGVTYTDTILGGTMELRGNLLDVKAQLSTSLRGHIRLGALCGAYDGAALPGRVTALHVCSESSLHTWRGRLVGMYVPWWILAGAVAVLLVARWRNRWLRRLEITTVRDSWRRLSRRRKQEILYVRERLHRSGPVGIPDYDSIPDAELQEWFENSLRNALDGEPWAFDLLKEQVYRHKFGAEPVWSTPATRRALEGRSLDVEDGAAPDVH